ncbi:MAG: hypothetical protein IPP98_05605 [Gemmatimonadetes bacterium]|nr:hypothetical protein [Gemmatimonadota bacterium]
MPSHIPVPSILLLAACLTACGTASRDAAGTSDSAGVTLVRNPARAAADSGPWTLVEGLRIAGDSGAEESQLGQLTDLALDPAGNVYTIDADRRVILKFSPAGALLRTFAGPGEGPGELGPGVKHLLAADNGTIAVVDNSNQRLHFYDSSGTHRTDQPMILRGGAPVTWGITPDGVVLMQLKRVAQDGDSTSTPISYIVRLTTPPDTILAIHGGGVLDTRGGLSTMKITLFQGEPSWTTLPSGRFVVGDPDRFAYREYGDGGVVTREVSLVAPRTPVTKEDQSAARTAVRDYFEKQFATNGPAPASMIETLLGNISFAEFYPTFIAMRPGPLGTIMVQRFLTIPEMRASGTALTMEGLRGSSSVWEVFSEAGQHLGPVRFPPTFRPLAVRGNAIWGIETNEMGVQSIVRLDVSERG